MTYDNVIYVNYFNYQNLRLTLTTYTRMATMPQGLRAEAAVPVVDSKKRPLIPPKAASPPLRGARCVRGVWTLPGNSSDRSGRSRMAFLRRIQLFGRSWTSIDVGSTMTAMGFDVLKQT